MANRVISTNLWNDTKWEGITNFRTRYVWLYLLTCPTSNSCGVWKLRLDHASVDTKLDIDELKRSIRELQDLKLCIYDMGTSEIAILKYPIYNLRHITPQIANLVRNGLKLVKNPNLVKAVYLTLKKNANPLYDLIIQEYENWLLGKGKGNNETIGKEKPKGNNKVKEKSLGLGLGLSNDSNKNIKVSKKEKEIMRDNSMKDLSNDELEDKEWNDIINELETIKEE